MNNYNLKNCDRTINSKKQNLLELSISEIWEKQFIDQNSDYQHQCSLINNIPHSHSDAHNQYGLHSLKQNTPHPLTPHRHSHQLNIQQHPQLHKTATESSHELELNSNLAFNKQIKRKKSYSKERIPYCSRSARMIVTKPVPSIQQHRFNPSVRRQMKSPLSRQTSKIIRPLQIQFKKLRIHIKTNLSQAPLKQSRAKFANSISKKLYHLMSDQFKFQVNDYNCQLIEQPSSKKSMSIQSQSPNATIIIRHQNNHDLLHLCKTQQLIKMNSTNTKTEKNQWCSSKASNNRIFEIYRNQSLGVRATSNFSSCKTERHAESSPFSKENMRRAAKMRKTSHSNSSNKNESESKSRNMLSPQETEYTRHSYIEQDLNKRYVQYFVNGVIQEQNKNILFSP